MIRTGTRRPTLLKLRGDVFDALDEDEFMSVAEMLRRLGLGAGIDHYRVALILERLAADGYAELRAQPLSQVRKFRRRPGMRLEFWQR